MSDLRQCPFCLCYPQMLDAFNESWVHCDTCGATGPHANGPVAAAQRWNRRPMDAKVGLRAERDALLNDLENDI